MVELVIVVALIGIGVWYGLQGTVPTRDSSKNKTDLQQCEEACDQWDSRRMDRCLADQDLANAQQNFKTIGDMLYAISIGGGVPLLVAIIGGAGGAAALATAVPTLAPIIPFILLIIALGILVALAIIIVLISALVTAKVDLNNKLRAAAAAATAEADARAIMLAVCPDPEAQQCLARPAPC